MDKYGYIGIETLLNFCENSKDHAVTPNDFMRMKRADVTERKTGKWERHNTYHGDDVSGFVDPDWRCSECGRQASVNAWFMYDLTDFCPNCGARMVQEGEEP